MLQLDDSTGISSFNLFLAHVIYSRNQQWLSSCPCYRLMSLLSKSLRKWRHFKSSLPYVRTIGLITPNLHGSNFHITGLYDTANNKTQCCDCSQPVLYTSQGVEKKMGPRQILRELDTTLLVVSSRHRTLQPHRDQSESCSDA